MSNKKIWMGIPEKHMQWVPAPLAGGQSSNNQFVETIQFENGGADARRSKGYHKSYEFEFNEPLEGSENLNVFNKFASGFYGDGLCVFADPYIFESNMFSAPWGTPWLVDSGWPNLYDGTPVISDLTGSVTTNLATNPSFETGSGTVEVRRNLVTNPRAVSGTGWLGISVTATYPTATGPFGESTTVAQADFDAVNDRLYFDTTNTLAAGPHFASVYVKAPVGKSIRVAVLSAGGGTFYAAEEPLVGNGEWQRRSVAFTAPGGAGFRVEARQWEASSSGTVSVTAMLVEASPVLGSYFDGSTSAGGDFTYAWTGTANASASVQNAVGVAGYASPPSLFPFYQSGQWFSAGAKSARFTRKGATQEVDFLNIGVTAGQTRTLKGVIHLSAPIANATEIRLGVRTFGGSTAEHFVTVPNVAGEHPVTLTFTASAGTTSTVARVWIIGPNAVGDLWLDDFMLVEGTYAGDYFDGATADTSTTDFAWTGTANASTSTMTMRDPVNTPAKAATWTITTAVNTPTTGGNHTFTIPVPPGYTLHVGASGTSTGTAVVQALPRAANGFAGTPVNLTLLDPNGTTRMNTTFVGSEELASVTFYLTRTTTAASTITLNSLMAQLYKTGTTPTLPTQHIPGEGHSGLEFVDDARPETYVYINPPRKALSTTLLEVGAWR